jgi:hypothetical protein
MESLFVVMISSYDGPGAIFLDADKAEAHRKAYGDEYVQEWKWNEVRQCWQLT